MRIEQRGEVKVFLCSCCNLPFAKLQFGRLVIQSKHHGDDHTNALGPEDLESILELLRQADAIIPAVPPKVALHKHFVAPNAPWTWPSA